MATPTKECPEWRKENYDVPPLVAEFRKTIEYYKKLYNNFIPKTNPSQNSQNVTQSLSELQKLNGILKDLLDGKNQKENYNQYKKLMDGFTDDQGTVVKGFLPILEEARAKKEGGSLLNEMDCARMIDLEMYPYTILATQTKHLYATPLPAAYQP